MSTRKTIQINPELFKLGNKTRKVREKKELPKPIISPHLIRNKLFKRVKEHKANEIKIHTDIAKQKALSPEKVMQDDSDEFYSAIGYLSELSKKHKVDAEKELYKKDQERKKQELWKKTIKNPYSLVNETNTSVGGAQVSLDLPPELEAPSIPNLNTNVSYGAPLNYKVDSVSPYGCLKSGIKPTFKMWQTRKQLPSFSEPTPINIPTINSAVTQNRTERLEQIKNKLKQLEEKDNNSITNVSSSLLEKDKGGFNLPNGGSSLPLSSLSGAMNILSGSSSGSKLLDSRLYEKESNKEKKEGGTKVFVKTTTHRKFTLGKSAIKRQVGVLIKNKTTRKNILNAQRELKKKPIADIKKYLRQRGIIKVGSTAPNDVLRKMYEMSMLAGDITNTNKDVLIHNFINGVDEDN